MTPNRYKGAHGGRGSAKSHFFAESVIERCIAVPGSRVVCVREVQKSLKESVKLLIEDKLQSLGVGHMFKVRHDRIIAPGNGTIIFQGMSDQTAESVKSLEGFDIAYVEEAQTFTKHSLEVLRPTIRANDDSEIWFSWNPRSASDPVDAFLRGDSVPDNAAVVRTSYRDNPFFPQVLEEERQYDRLHNPERYAHIWEGEYEPKAIGAIWDRANINEYRRDETPDMGRILVSVDPAVSSEDGSNEHGIVVGGLGEDGRGYVLEDASMHGAPRQWADRTVAMHDKWEADGIVVERNQGGDMVKNTLLSVRNGLNVIEVVATRGKHVRAEPISSLYSLGRVSHVGAFPQLEDQMCMMTAAGYDGDGSPDRVDALVWLFSELFARMTRKIAPEARRHAERRVVQHGWLGA